MHVSCKFKCIFVTCGTIFIKKRIFCLLNFHSNITGKLTYDEKTSQDKDAGFATVEESSVGRKQVNRSMLFLYTETVSTGDLRLCWRSVQDLVKGTNRKQLILWYRNSLKIDFIL